MNLIQIGANDGKDHVFDYVSRNRDVISRLTLIEANPGCIPRLTDTYGDFPLASIHNYAVVSGEDSTVTLLIPVGDSTSEHVSASSEHMTRHGHRAPLEVVVPAKNINRVLEEAGAIDRLYIDVEGYDISLVNQIDFSRFSIPYLYFEYIHSDGPHSFGGPQLDACNARLISLGYSLSKEEYNIIAHRLP